MHDHPRSSDYPRSFDEVYSISDIHMGGVHTGAENFQIFNRGARLGAFCRHLASADGGGSRALVLNGDIIDSLAEPGAGYVALTEQAAQDMIRRIFDDPSFRPVWDGLAEFVATPDRYLVVVAGNHDIELGLPVVEHAIRARLTDGDPAADARITFSARGAGYSCRVGRARAYFTHGNEADPWNRVDNEKLGQLANAQNAGRGVPVDDWTPNAGTRLVVDVMNDIKQQYAFVDLLKPQNSSLAAILLTLRSDALKYVRWSDITGMAKSARRSKRAQNGLLSVDELAVDPELAELAPVDARDAVLDLLGPNLTEHVASGGVTASEDELLLRAAAGELPDQYVDGEGPTETLGVGSVVRGLLPGGDSREALRRALQDWNQAAPHRQTEEDDWLSKAVRERGPQVNFTVAGHTHRARSIPFRDERAHYFNSGTWIRLMQLTDQALERAAFGPVWDALDNGSLDALDALMIPGADGPQPLMDDFTTAVRLRATPEGAVGDLVQVTDGPAGGVAIAAVAGTERGVLV